MDSSAGFRIWNMAGMLVGAFVIFLFFRSIILLYGLEQVFFVSLNFYLGGLLVHFLGRLLLSALGYKKVSPA